MGPQAAPRCPLLLQAPKRLFLSAGNTGNCMPQNPTFIVGVEENPMAHDAVLFAIWIAGAFVLAGVVLIVYLT
jgi:hypothetical protein